MAHKPTLIRYEFSLIDQGLQLTVALLGTGANASLPPNFKNLIATLPLAKVAKTMTAADIQLKTVPDAMLGAWVSKSIRVCDVKQGGHPTLMPVIEAANQGWLGIAVEDAIAEVLKPAYPSASTIGTWSGERFTVDVVADTAIPLKPNNAQPAGVTQAKPKGRGKSANAQPQNASSAPGNAGGSPGAASGNAAAPGRPRGPRRPARNGGRQFLDVWL